jgi:hypothetical protein
MNQLAKEKVIITGILKNVDQYGRMHIVCQIETKAELERLVKVFEKDEKEKLAVPFEVSEDVTNAKVCFLPFEKTRLARQYFDRVGQGVSIVAQATKYDFEGTKGWSLRYVGVHLSKPMCKK